MIQAFAITLREGLEAFLVVAVALAYLRKSRQDRLVPAVRWAIVVSVLCSLAAADFFRHASDRALWQGSLTMVAAVFALSLIVHVAWHVRRIGGEIELCPEQSAAPAGFWAFVGVFAFTVLMIGRKGMETAMLLSTLLLQVRAVDVATSAAAGTACAAFVAWLWSRYGHRASPGLFLQVTAVFLGMFVLQLLVYGLCELNEANVFPNSELLHWTEPYGPDGRYGQHLAYLLFLLPLGWLVVAGAVGAGRRTGSSRLPGLR